METIKPIYKASQYTMILTTFHHLYGASIYDTPFRLHVVFISLPVVLVTWLCYRLLGNRPLMRHGKLAKGIFMLFLLLGPLATFGFFEGGYNHLLKNLLYFGGASKELLLSLFPPPVYELPNEFIFEFTGVLQFFTALWPVKYFYGHWFKKPTVDNY